MDFESAFVKKHGIYNILTGELCKTYKNVPALKSWCKFIIYNNVEKNETVTNYLFKKYINETSIKQQNIILFCIK